MSNQPAPTRPWFRLTSISRSPPQKPAPAPPRPATLGPAFRPPPTLATQPNAAASPPAAGGVSSVTTSPVGRASQPSSPADKKPTTSTMAPATVKTSSVPGSPVKTVSTTSLAKPTTTEISPAKNAPTTTPASSLTQKSASSVTTTSRMPGPKASTTTAVKPAIQNQKQSPKTKLPTARPTSPLTLPLSQMKAQAERENKIPAEADQKTVLVQKMIDKPSIPLNGHKEPFKEGETKEKGRGSKYSSDSEDAGMRIITITGDNKGAFMKIFQSPHKNVFQGQKKANSSSGSGEAADGKMKAKRNLSKTMPTNAFINSNVQGINNSIVYNSSCTQHDPGVHLALNTKPTLGGFHVKEHTNGYNS